MARLIDLSHTIIPNSAGRKFKIEMVGADEINPNVIRLENQWYVMHNISMVNHIGTHIEAPFHLLKNGKDVSQISLDRLCGEAVILNLKEVLPRSSVTIECIQKAAKEAGDIKQGDIVLCNLGFSKYYGKPEYKNNPYFSTESIEWLIEKGMKLMGVDTSGVELPANEEHINHYTLFINSIPLIENMCNLDSISGNRIQIYAFPLAVKGLDSFPLRVIALEY
ncbi:MAG: cyclase family protein [Atribacterota bacterium]|nr:cyclase family protein [Atribacterota bacterium]